MSVTHAHGHLDGPFSGDHHGPSHPHGDPTGYRYGYETAYDAAGGATVSAGGPAGPVYVATPPNGFTRFFLKLYDRSPRWFAPAAVLLCFASAATYVWFMNPTNGGAYDMPTCIVKMTTGFDCPGCGGTRAFYYLLHGNIPEAARHHAMAVFAAPFAAWLFIAWSIKHVWGKTIPAPKIGSKTISVFLAAWFVFMFARNIPIAPFTSLYV
jgi:Protein of unknown function (DUF2752)